MTMAEFVRKYEVPQDIVREASFKFDNRRDLDELRLRDHVRKIIQRRITTHSDAILSLSNQLSRIDGVNNEEPKERYHDEQRK